MAGISEVIKSLNAVYVVMTESSDGSIIGGGVCINSSGLIVTTAVLAPPHLKQVTLRSRNFTGFRPARVLHVNSCFGMAFLIIDDIEEDEVFDCVHLEDDDLSLEEGDGFFSWIHNNKIVFSLITGKVSFPFESAIFPSFTSTDTVDSAK